MPRPLDVVPHDRDLPAPPHVVQPDDAAMRGNFISHEKSRPREPDHPIQSSPDQVWVKEEDVWAAWKAFVSFDDKTWSFTDCVSYAVMLRRGIVEAFALDNHFKQFGFTTVRP